MKKLLIALAITSLGVTAATAQTGRTTGPALHSFRLGAHDFLLDGKPFQIISGEMHPARIPRPYWRQRIRMAKAMGCNTIAAYVFWNYLETKGGHFDFRTENRDIAAFIRIARHEGMYGCCSAETGRMCCAGMGLRRTTGLPQADNSRYQGPLFRSALLWRRSKR